MPTISPTYPLPYPGLSDQANGPDAFYALANATVTQLSRIDNRPGLSVRRATVQSIANTTVTPITWAGATVELANGITAPTASTIAIPTAGLWAVSCYGLWATESTGSRAMGFRLVGSGSYLTYDARPAANVSSAVNLSSVLWLAAGNYEFTAYQNRTSGTLDLAQAACGVFYLRGA